MAAGGRAACLTEKCPLCQHKARICSTKDRRKMTLCEALMLRPTPAPLTCRKTAHSAGDSASASSEAAADADGTHTSHTCAQGQVRIRLTSRYLFLQTNNRQTAGQRLAFKAFSGSCLPMARPTKAAAANP
jgi:hypothetical protein